MCVILALIQIGGLGYMTFGSFVILVGEQHFPRFLEKVAKAVFILPKGVPLKPFLRNVILFLTRPASFHFFVLRFLRMRHF